MSNWGGWVVYLEAMARCHCQGRLWTSKRMIPVMETLAMPAFCSQKASGLLPTDTEAIVMEALWEAWGWK